MMAKKESKIWAFVKWAAAIGGGAVVGAYTVRFVDRKFGTGAGAPSVRDEAVGGAVGGGEAYGLESSPMANPLAAQAISPMVAMPMAMPFPQFAPFPSMPIQMPTPNPAPAPADRAERVESAAAARARKQAEFDEIVRRFEEDDL